MTRLVPTGGVRAVADLVQTGAYRGGWSFVRALPEGGAARLFDAGADLAARRGGKGVLRLRSNLRRVVGPEVPEADLDALTRRAVRSYARYWREVFRPQTYDVERIAAHTVVDGWDFVEPILYGDRGAVLALPHSGNWDQAGAYLTAVLGVPFTTVAERLEPEAVFQQFVAFREGLGMEVVALSGHERPPFDVLADRLRAGRVVCLVAERDLSSRGVPVTFFGEEARFPAGPAALALDTGAALTPINLWFTERGWTLWCRGEIVPPEEGDRAHKIQVMTQRLADAFAVGIAAHPQDWHMLQRIWTVDLDPAKAPGEGGE